MTPQYVDLVPFCQLLSPQNPPFSGDFFFLMSSLSNNCCLFHPIHTGPQIGWTTVSWYCMNCEGRCAHPAQALLWLVILELTEKVCDNVDWCQSLATLRETDTASASCVCKVSGIHFKQNKTTFLNLSPKAHMSICTSTNVWSVSDMYRPSPLGRCSSQSMQDHW